jgi:hypothetical protein
MNLIISPNWPQNLPIQMGATVWYDACRPGSILTGDKVGAWNDLTGNGFHLLQSTDLHRPVWTDNQQNGRPGIVFLRSAAGGMSTGSAFFSNDTKSTFIVAVNITNHTAGENPWVIGCASTNANTRPAIRLSGDSGGLTSVIKQGTPSCYKWDYIDHTNIPSIMVATYNMTSLTDQVPVFLVNNAAIGNNVYQFQTGYMANQPLVISRFNTVLWIVFNLNVRCGIGYYRQLKLHACKIIFLKNGELN